ncbi:MAG: hypothetical protein NTU53_01830 [Planctomycetota bacterium]|nr:hypothetical protein [Planctomycetota bacterium]
MLGDGDDVNSEGYQTAGDRMGESGFGVPGEEEDSAEREHGFGYGLKRMVRRASEEVMSEGGAIGGSAWGRYRTGVSWGLWIGKGLGVAECQELEIRSSKLESNSKLETERASRSQIRISGLKLIGNVVLL